MEYIFLLTVILLLAGIIFSIVRPRRKKAKKQVRPTLKKLPRKMTPDEQQEMLLAMQSMAAEKPEAAARIVKDWLAGDKDS